MAIEENQKRGLKTSDIPTLTNPSPPTQQRRLQSPLSASPKIVNKYAAICVLLLLYADGYFICFYRSWNSKLKPREILVAGCACASFGRPSRFRSCDLYLIKVEVNFPDFAKLDVRTWLCIVSTLASETPRGNNP